MNSSEWLKMATSRGFIFHRSALVYRDFLRSSRRTQGFEEEAVSRNHVTLGCQEGVDGVALLVHGAVEVFLLSLDLDVGLIHPPTSADRPLLGTFKPHFSTFFIWVIIRRCGKARSFKDCF